MLLLTALLACEEPPPPPPPVPVPHETVAPPPDAAPVEVLSKPPTYGKVCSDSDQCDDNPDGHTGWCFCHEPLPKGPDATTGFCWNGPVEHGGKWWCLVEDGHALPTGIVFP